nr:hypothetical protein [Candidatus Sigynarchaeota archaeon]
MAGKKKTATSNEWFFPMHGASNRVHSAVIYLGYIIFFSIFSTFVSSTPPEWAIEIEAAALIPLEKDVLNIFSRSMNFLTPLNIIVIAIGYFSLTLVSAGKTKVPVVITVIQFFMFFFGIYFFTRFIPSFFPTRTTDVTLMIVIFVIMVVSCSFVPSTLLKKLINKRNQEKQKSIVIPKNFNTCKKCGATFQSNAKLCSSCFSNIDA